MSEDIQLARYRHYRGGFYDVIALATDIDSGEAMVVYRAVEGERKTWVRRASVFAGTVEKRPRFALCSAIPRDEATP